MEFRCASEEDSSYCSWLCVGSSLSSLRNLCAVLLDASAFNRGVTADEPLGGLEILSLLPTLNDPGLDTEEFALQVVSLGPKRTMRSWAVVDFGVLTLDFRGLALSARSHRVPRRLGRGLDRGVSASSQRVPRRLDRGVSASSFRVPRRLVRGVDRGVGKRGLATLGMVNDPGFDLSCNSFLQAASLLEALSATDFEFLLPGLEDWRLSCGSNTKDSSLGAFLLFVFVMPRISSSLSIMLTRGGPTSLWPVFLPASTGED